MIDTTVVRHVIIRTNKIDFVKIENESIFDKINSSKIDNVNMISVEHKIISDSIMIERQEMIFDADHDVLADRIKISAALDAIDDAIIALSDRLDFDDDLELDTEIISTLSAHKILTIDE